MGPNPMNSEIIETMARGMRKARYGYSDPLTWQDRSAAQAALQALLDGGWVVVEREPTEAMNEASKPFRKGVGETAERLYRVMVSTSLQGQEDQGVASWDQSPSTTRAPLASEQAGPEGFSGTTTAEQWAALKYAQRLATVAASKFGPPEGWRPLDDMYGVLTQIDNALTGLSATPKSAAPKVGDTFIRDGRLWRCYEIELEGAKYTDVGPVPNVEDAN